MQHPVAEQPVPLALLYRWGWKMSLSVSAWSLNARMEMSTVMAMMIAVII